MAGSQELTLLPLYNRDYTKVAIQKSYRMTTTELFLIHTTHPLWVGCVSASHTSSLLLRPFWNIADCYGREERAWCLKSMVRTVHMAKPDVSGEGQQVFANSNIVCHTLHYTFPPFLSLSYPKHFPVFWHFPVFPFTYIQNENATWQTPTHPSRPSSNKLPLMLSITLDYPSLKWLLSSLALTTLDTYLKQGMFIMCCKCFLTFLTPDPGTVSYSFLYHLCLMQCLAHGRIECAQ